MLNLISKRKHKLEQIKNYISLKTYHLINEKLEAEERLVLTSMQIKEKEQQKREQPQSMPKVFFEQKFLKPRLIRIN